ncbi:MAG TPA: hypothetical protein PLB42_04250, partial [Kiritimatiellia bacterium]|nr:hypothetical protein [Kiritimatiellia bacterium]
PKGNRSSFAFSSYLWKNKGRRADIFPRYGKGLVRFSTQWNNFGPVFPHCGKTEVNFSTLWKIPPMRDKNISTLWKTCRNAVYGWAARLAMMESQT